MKVKLALLCLVMLACLSPAVRHADNALAMLSILKHNFKFYWIIPHDLLCLNSRNPMSRNVIPITPVPVELHLFVF